MPARTRSLVVSLFGAVCLLSAQTLDEKIAQLRTRFGPAVKAADGTSQLRTAIDGAMAALDEVSRRLDAGESADEAMPLLEARRKQLAQADTEIERTFHSGEKTDTRRRHHANYRRRADATRKALEMERPSREAIVKARRAIAAAFAEPAGQWSAAIGTPREKDLGPIPPAKIIAPLPRNADADDLPTPGDLAASGIVRIVPEIQALAASLGGDPARIFAWVSNNVAFEYYASAMQNSHSALWSRRASDYDTATLLIALLRSARVPARYVNGTIALSMSELTTWMGARNPDAALFMARQAFPIRTTTANEVTFDHAWVEAYVPTASGPAWVALDASFKTRDYQPGILIPKIPFAYDAYLSSVKPNRADEVYLDQVRQYIQQNLPGRALSELGYTGPIKPVTDAALPAALPYRVTSVIRRITELAPEDKHRVIVIAESRDGTAKYFTHELAVPDVSLQSVTISMTGFRPQLRLDNQVAASSNVILGATGSINIRVQYFQPRRTEPRFEVDRTLRVNEAAALGIDALQSHPKYLEYRIDRLLASNPDTADPEQTVREILHIGLMRWWERWAEVKKRTSEPLQLTYLFWRPQVAFTFSTVAGRNLFDRPFIVTPNALTLDSKGGNTLLADLNSGNLTTPQLRDFRRMMSLAASALEHELWEELVLVPSASTVKLLQVANGNRLPILKFNSATAAAGIRALPFSDFIKTDMQDYLREGLTNITVPSQPVTYLQLRAVAYIAEDDDGFGRTIISNADGGVTAANPPPSQGPGPGPTGNPDSTNGTYCSDPVTVSNGNLFQQQIDLAISSRGPSIVLKRTYNSQLSAADGPFGYGWSHTYGMSLRETASSVTFVNETGGAFSFTLQGGSYVAPAGVNITLVKDAQGFTLRSPAGVQLAFNARGVLQTITDRNRNALQFGYDTSGRLIRIADALNRAVTLAYNAQNHIVSVQDFANRVIAYTYDAAGNLASVTDVAGRRTAYTYYTERALAHLLQTMRDPGGNVTTYRYYSDRKAARVSDAAGRDARFSYLPMRNETVFMDARGFAGSYFYNSLGNVTRIVKADGNYVDSVYTADAKLATRTDEHGNTTRYTYDAQGNLTSITNPAGAAVRFTYEPNFNQIASVTNARGVVTRFEYDARGNLTRIARPLGVESRFTYDNFGQLLTAVDGEGNTVSFTYDASGNPTKIADALGNATEFQFDTLRRSTRGVDAMGGTGSVEYDALNRIVRAIDPMGREVAAAYDANGNLSQATDANGGVTRYSYDALNNLSRVTDAQANIHGYAYIEPDCGCSTGSNLVSFSDAAGRARTLAYDFNNRLIQASDSAGAVTGFGYNARGDLTRKTDANARTIRYEYDAAGRLVRKIFPDGTEAGYTYSANGKLTGASNANTSVSFTYDELNRIASAADSRFDKTIRYEYNRNGRRTALTDSEGGVTTYAYDANSRLTSVTSPAGANVKLSYDALNRRTGMAYANGSGVAYEYDAASRITSLAHGGALQRYAYTYDKNGNPATISSSAGIRTYQYDELNRLTAAGPESYSYDGAGNRLASAGDPAYLYDAAGRLTSAEGATYTYDNNGNITRRSDSTGTTVYTYDFENQLVKIDFPDAAIAGYKYDALGRRIEKNVRGVVTAYLYDGVNILLELDSSGQMLARYTHGAGTDEPLTMERGGKTYFYHADRLGSIAAISDASGSAVCGYAYDSFGRAQARECSAVASPYGFAGREYDAESGLYYMRARYYDPVTGRFLSADPMDLTGLLMTAQDRRAATALIPPAALAVAGAGGVGAPQQLNRYSYAVNNPLVYRDPSGLKTCDTTPPWQRPGWRYDEHSGLYEGPPDLPYLTSLRDKNGDALFDWRGNLEDGYSAIPLGTRYDQNPEWAVVSNDKQDSVLATFPTSAYGYYKPEFDELPAEYQTVWNVPVADTSVTQVVGAVPQTVKNIPGGMVDAYNYLNNQAPEWARF